MQDKINDPVAPEGMLWVCMACGKTQTNSMGGGEGSRRWDESCFMRCELFEKDRLVYGPDDRVVRILKKEEKKNAVDAV